MRKPVLFRLFRWSEGSQLNQYIMTMMVTFSTLVFGMIMGWVSPAIPQLQSPDGPLGHPISAHHLGWMASATFLVAFPAMLVTGTIADRLGRRIPMLFASLTFVMCWLLKIVYAKSEMIITARAISGLGNAVVYVVAPIYVKEISDDNIRGTTCSLVILAQNLGFIIMYIIGDALSYQTVLWVSLVIPAAHFVVFLSAPETPCYLVKAKKIQEATEVLAWLRCMKPTDRRIMDEINKLDAEENSVRTASGEMPAWKILVTDKPTMRAFVICVAILMGQECCGYLILLTYASVVFSRAGGSTLTDNQQTIVLGFVQLAGSVFASCLIERIGRKPLLSVMSCATGLGMATLGTWFYVTSVGTAAPGWVPICAMCLSIFSTAAGFQPTPFVIFPEMFSFKLRGLVSSILVSFTALGDFVQTVAYEPVTNAIGIFGTFWVFSIVCFLSTTFTLAFLPETRNKSLDEIYEKLGRKREIKGIRREMEVSTVL